MHYNNVLRTAFEMISDYLKEPKRVLKISIFNITSLFLQQDSAAAVAQMEGEEHVWRGCIHRGNGSSGDGVLFSLGHVCLKEPRFDIS